MHRYIGWVILSAFFASACTPQNNESAALPTLAQLPTLTQSSTPTDTPTSTFTLAPSFTPTLARNSNPTATITETSTPTAEPATLPPMFTQNPYQVSYNLTSTAIFANAGNFEEGSRLMAYRIILENMRISRVWGGGDATVEIVEPGFLHFIYYYDARPIYPGFTSDAIGVLRDAESRIPETICDLRAAGITDWTIMAEIRVTETDDGGTGNHWCISRGTLLALNCDAPRANVIWSTPVPSFACTLTG